MDRNLRATDTEERLFDALVAEAGFEPVGDFDVARLRRRVTDGVRAERRQGAWHGQRYSLAAAALAFAALALVGLGSRPLAPEASATLALTLTDDGSVRIAYADGRPIERVIRTRAPKAPAEKVARVAGAREYLDKNGQPRPGTVVFYKVD